VKREIFWESCNTRRTWLWRRIASARKWGEGREAQSWGRGYENWRNAGTTGSKASVTGYSNSLVTSLNKKSKKISKNGANTCRLRQFLSSFCQAFKMSA
jgi:hypothetical protein